MRRECATAPGRWLRLASAAAALVALTACGDSGSSADAQSELEVDSTLTTEIAHTAGIVRSKRHLTMNEYWDSSDMASIGIAEAYRDIRWSGDGGPFTPRTETFTLPQYQANLAACEADSASAGRGDENCFPRVGVDRGAWEDGCANIDFPALRYGRWCGQGFGDNGAPIDPVDFCCRLHDGESWDQSPGQAASQNACGMIMCLWAASGTAAITDQMWRVEESRQCWFEWAEALCGTDLESLPAPAVASPLKIAPNQSTGSPGPFD